VVLLDNFLPEMIRRELIHHHKRDDENEHAEKGKRQCSDDIAERNKVHLICLQCSGGSRCKRIDRSRDCHERTWEHFSTGWPCRGSSRCTERSRCLLGPTLHKRDKVF